MDIAYFFILGFIFTIMSLGKLGVSTPKHLKIFNKNNMSKWKVFKNIVLGWIFSGNLFLLLNLLFRINNSYLANYSSFRAILVTLILGIDIFIMPIYIFSKILKFSETLDEEEHY